MTCGIDHNTSAVKMVGECFPCKVSLSKPIAILSKTLFAIRNDFLGILVSLCLMLAHPAKVPTPNMLFMQGLGCMLYATTVAKTVAAFSVL